jgi:outer membrane protein OmpA-like peptidoglycan-associated protein
MKHLHSFNQYNNDEKVDEGAKDWLLGSLMLLGSVAGYGQNLPKVGHKDVDKKHYISTIKKDYAEKDSVMMASDERRLLKQGWTKLATDIDTLWNETIVKVPDTIVSTLSLKFDNQVLFGSGRFDLTPEVKSELDSAFQQLLDQSGILTGVKVVSSTDKTPIGQRLQSTLKSMNLSPDNDGLSKARSNSIKSYLVSGVNVDGDSLPINDTLITENNLSEQGSINDPGARYVYVNITFLSSKSIAGESEELKRTPTTKTTVYYQKEFEKTKKKKHFHFRLPKFRIFNFGKIGKNRQTSCPKW